MQRLRWWTTAAFSLIFCFLAISPALAADFSPEDRAVVQLRTATKKGTGFFISDDGFLLTNFHVIDGASSVEVCSQAATRLVVTCDESAEILADDPQLDIALLRLKRKPARAKSFLSLGDSDLLAPGDAIRLYGFPDSGGDRLTVSSGKVTGFFEGRDFVKVDASLSHGSSGGAMTDSGGTVVGMTMAILKEGDRESGLIIPVNRVKDWLDHSGFGEDSLLGESLPALFQSKAVFEARLERYLSLSLKQAADYDEITATYEAMRLDEANDRDAALDRINRNEQSERERVDAYLQNYAEQADEAAYAAEAERVQGLWNEFAAQILSRRERVNDVYDDNLRVIAQMEAIALEKAGVADYSARITELRTLIRELDAKIGRLKREAAKPAPSPPSVADQAPKDGFLAYDGFGSMQPRALGDWELRSVTFRKNGADFAFVFWKLPDFSPLPGGARVAAVITDAAGGPVTPIVVRKKFLLFRYVPGTSYRFALSFGAADAPPLSILRFTAEAAAAGR